MMSKVTYPIDNDGKVVKEWESEYSIYCAYLLQNGHLLLGASPGFMGNRTFMGGGAGEKVLEFTWDGGLVREFDYSSDEHLLHHDIEPTPNGNALMIAWEHKTAEEAAETNGRISA